MEGNNGEGSCGSFRLQHFPTLSWRSLLPTEPVQGRFAKTEIDFARSFALDMGAIPARKQRKTPRTLSLMCQNPVLVSMNAFWLTLYGGAGVAKFIHWFAGPCIAPSAVYGLPKSHMGVRLNLAPQPCNLPQQLPTGAFSAQLSQDMRSSFYQFNEVVQPMGCQAICIKLLSEGNGLVNRHQVGICVRNLAWQAPPWQHQRAKSRPED